MAFASVHRTKFVFEKETLLMVDVNVVSDHSVASTGKIKTHNFTAFRLEVKTVRKKIKTKLIDS